MCPSDFSISVTTAFSRSSNSPRNFAPATSEPKSRDRSRLFLRLSGTSPDAMRRASPSTTAVLPTPGSPISTGLFFVRRHSTCITRRISSSRPITGSILSCRAAAVKSRVYFSNARMELSGSWESTCAFPRTDFKASSTASCVMPFLRKSSPAALSDSVIARRICSVERYESLSFDI